MLAAWNVQDRGGGREVSEWQIRRVQKGMPAYNWRKASEEEGEGGEEWKDSGVQETSGPYFDTRGKAKIVLCDFFRENFHIDDRQSFPSETKKL